MGSPSYNRSHHRPARPRMCPSLRGVHPEHNTYGAFCRRYYKAGDRVYCKKSPLEGNSPTRRGPLRKGKGYCVSSKPRYQVSPPRRTNPKVPLALLRTSPLPNRRSYFQWHWMCQYYNGFRIMSYSSGRHCGEIPHKMVVEEQEWV